MADSKSQNERPAIDQDPVDPALMASVIEVLRARVGIDFAAYRAATLRRRIALQARAAGARTHADYLARLTEDAFEAERLAARITIKTSGFFRDAPVFDALGRLLAGAPERSLRCWSAGCAQGEEAWSLAILARECRPRQPPAVIATDIDPAALRCGQAARYAPHLLRDVGHARLASCFDTVRIDRQLAYRVRPDLQALVRFVRHDLSSSPTGPSDGAFDVILCRNVLIYWSRAAQERIQRLLAASLTVSGLLCLGPAEWLAPAVAAGFEIADRHHRIFRRLDSPITRGLG